MVVMRHHPSISAAAGALLAATLLSTPSAHAQMACISDWSEAAPIVRREGLVPMEHVDRLARDRSSVQILRSSLCKDRDRYVYRLTVRAGEGTMRTLVVDARHPFD